MLQAWGSGTHTRWWEHRVVLAFLSGVWFAWPCGTACGVSRPGTGPGCPAVEAQSPDPWTTGEFPQLSCLFKSSPTVSNGTENQCTGHHRAREGELTALHAALVCVCRAVAPLDGGPGCPDPSSQAGDSRPPRGLCPRVWPPPPKGDGGEAAHSGLSSSPRGDFRNALSVFTATLGHHSGSGTFTGSRVLLTGAPLHTGRPSCSQDHLAAHKPGIQPPSPFSTRFPLLQKFLKKLDMLLTTERNHSTPK